MLHWASVLIKEPKSCPPSLYLALQATGARKRWARREKVDLPVDEVNSSHAFPDLMNCLDIFQARPHFDLSPCMVNGKPSPVSCNEDYIQEMLLDPSFTKRVRRLTHDGSLKGWVITAHYRERPHKKVTKKWFGGKWPNGWEKNIAKIIAK